MDDEQRSEETTPRSRRPIVIVGVVLAALFLIGLLTDDGPDQADVVAADTGAAARERADSICAMVRSQATPDPSAIAREHGIGRAAVMRIARGGCPQEWARYLAAWTPTPAPERPSPSESPEASGTPTATASPTLQGQRFGTGEIMIEDGSCQTTSGDFFEFAGTVRNTSSRVMSYSVTSGLFDSAGVRIGEGLGHAQYVRPGETAGWETIGQYRGRGAECRVVNVEEYAS